MLQDYELAASGNEQALHQRSRERYREWVDISEVALRREYGVETDLN